MISGHILTTNCAPFRERGFRQGDRVRDICADELPARIIVSSVPVSLELSEGCDGVHHLRLYGCRVLLVFWRERCISHSLMVEHPGKSRALVGERPNSPRNLLLAGETRHNTRLRPHAAGKTPGFPYRLSLPSGERRQVSRRLSPRRFLQCFLLREASEIVVGENAHGREIKLPRQPPNNLRSNIS